MIKEKTERTIFDDYKWEISEIDDILKKLYRGQVMEISGNRFDGKLSTNIERLRDGMATSLICGFK